jgi:hypothetical protein
LIMCLPLGCCLTQLTCRAALVAAPDVYRTCVQGGTGLLRVRLASALQLA